MRAPLLSCILLLTLLLVLVRPAVAQSGLRATFYRGQDFSGTPLLTRNDAAINFNWDYDRPAFNIPQENYCVRWTGALRAPVSGTYTFTISTDDGMRVWLGDKLIFDEWRPQSPSKFQKKIALQAGEFYPLRVEYYQLGYQARAVLSWQLPNENAQRAGNLFGVLKSKPTPIPASAFYVRMPRPEAPSPVAAAPAVVAPPIPAAVAKPVEKPVEKPAAASPPVAKPVTVATPKPRPVVRPRPVAKPTPKPAPKPTPKPAPKPISPRPTSKPAPKPASLPKPTPKPVAAATPVMRPAPRVVQRSAVARPVPAPTPAPIPAPIPAPAAVGSTATGPNLGALPKGATVEIKDLFFEQSQARLLPASTPAIRRLAEALVQYPRVALEIAGHTDNVGNPTANQQLSEARARLVRALLIERGIDSTRLTAVGYGGTRPVSSSNEPLLRARNRRVEVTVR